MFEFLSGSRALISRQYEVLRSVVQVRLSNSSLYSTNKNPGFVASARSNSLGGRIVSVDSPDWVNSGEFSELSGLGNSRRSNQLAMFFLNMTSDPQMLPPNKLVYDATILAKQLISSSSALQL